MRGWKGGQEPGPVNLLRDFRLSLKSYGREQGQEINTASGR